MPLDDPLHHNISPATRTEIIHHLWPQHSTSHAQIDDQDWVVYFTFYARQCRHALAYDGSLSSAKTHQDIVSIAKLLGQGASRDEIKQTKGPLSTQSNYPDEENGRFEVSITLAVRLLAMVDIADLPEEFTGRGRLPWAQGSLQNAMHQYFEVDLAPVLDDDDIVLEKIFTAYNITGIAGIGIVWTNNIMDHLRLLENNRNVCIFHQVTFLKWLKSSSSDIYPAGLIEETLTTLILLFPSLDVNATHHLAPLLSTIAIDHSLSKCGQMKAKDLRRELSHYRFWHDRLAMLKEAFDEAEPTTRIVRRHLFDDKKGDRWFNSWVAMVAIGLTLFFGLVQSVEGGIQVYKAYHPTSG